MMLNKMFIRIKKITIIFLGCLAIIALLFPYVFNLYIEKKYFNLAKNIVSYNQNLTITHDIKRNYLSSYFITKITRLDNNKDLLVLQHNLKNVLFSNKNNILEIQTKILSGLPGFLEQEKILFAVTTIALSGQVKTIINPINLEYIVDLDELSSIQAKSMAMQIEYHDQKFNINLDLPKIIYAEEHNKAEIDDVQFNIALANNNLKILTDIDRIYLVKNLKPILRLVNFTMSHNIDNIDSDKSQLNSNLSFLRLNVIDQKFGPLATKWQINNINLPTIFNNINTINFQQFDSYKFIEIGNRLLKFHPNVALDILLNTNSGKLKLLTDFSANIKEADWFSKEDILDSLQANIAANVPKKIFIELVGLLLEEKLKKENFIKNNNYNNKQLEKQLEKMVVERVGYLLKHNIITEKENSFMLDLSIAEGTFYSRMNPLKLFSF
jgi:hypothetical protein